MSPECAGSTSAPAGLPFISPYCASKAALATFTRNTAFAAMRNKIRVNQLNIGWMASDGENRTQREYLGADANWLEKWRQSSPLNGSCLPRKSPGQSCSLPLRIRG